MKGLLKKSLAFILALTMVFGVTPIVGLAGGGLPNPTGKPYGVLYYEIHAGKVTITGCDYSATGEVEIPESIEGYPVTSIGGYAFCGCSRLTSVTIPDSVTNIGKCAFYDCKALTSVTIPDSVMSISIGTFFGCTSLTSITVDGDNPSYSSDEFGVLFNKDKTELIQYPAGNTGNIYVVPNSVTSIGDGALSYCDRLTSITIGNGVMSIGEEAFYNCTGLISITIPDSVTNIGTYAFQNCTRLTSVIIGNGVRSIGDLVFYGCTGLTSVTIPDSVTSIGDGAFEDCSSLTDVYYSSSEAAWNSITIGEGNENLTNANIHFHYISDTNVIEEPVVDNEIVKNPSTSSITYGDLLVLHVDSSKIPEGGYVEWTSSNGNFDMSVSADGTTCTVSPKSSGKTVFTATIYDKDGNAISTDTQEMTAKAGFFDKIIAFFKKIFGLTKTFPEAFKVIL